MELTEIYSEIAQNDIYMCNFKMKKTKARIIQDNTTCIFVDYSQINSYIEEKEILAEELGHYKYNAYYTLLSDKTFIEQQEYKAMKWKALHLCPLKSIVECFIRGITNYIDIAENLQIEPITAQFAINYYRENNLLSFSDCQCS